MGGNLALVYPNPLNIIWSTTEVSLLGILDILDVNFVIEVIIGVKGSNTLYKIKCIAHTK